MIWVLDTNLPGDPLELLPSRVSRREMALHMVEQTRHLTKDIAVRSEVEEVRLGSIEVALCPLDKWSISEDPEPSARVEWHHLSCLPGRIKVKENRLR